VKAIFKAAEAPIEWEEQHIGKEVDPRTNSFITRENLDSVLVRWMNGWMDGFLYPCVGYITAQWLM